MAPFHPIVHLVTALSRVANVTPRQCFAHARKIANRELVDAVQLSRKSYVFASVNEATEATSALKSEIKPVKLPQVWKNRRL